MVVATTLAGTLLASALVASTRHLKQIRAAERKRFAVGLLDQQLATLMAEGQVVETADDPIFNGPDGSKDRFVVHTKVVGPSPLGLGSVVRVSVSAVDMNNREHPAASAEVLVAR